MKINKSSIPKGLNHESTIGDILLACGFCNKAQIEQATTSAKATSVPARSYLEMLRDYETLGTAGDGNVADLLVAQGVISTRDRQYAQMVQSVLRTAHTECSCPAARFRALQNSLRESLHKLLGGQKLDEATPDVSHFPYAPKDGLAGVE